MQSDITNVQLVAAIEAVGAQVDDDEDLFRRQYDMARRAGLGLDALDKIIAERKVRSGERRAALSALVARIEERFAELQARAAG